ncbi:MAG: hypothetical protein WC849_02830 [Candidatus Paceibacterota bacterium]
MPTSNKQNSSRPPAVPAHAGQTGSPAQGWWHWDKSKLLQALLIPLVAVLLIVGIDYGITQIKLSQIPESLRINTNRDNIIGAQVIPQGKIYDKQDPTKVIYEGEVVKYAYKTDKIEDKPNEVIEKRTKHSRTIKIGEDKKKQTITYQLEVISGVPQYYQDENGEWYQADYGTTDIDTYALETRGGVTLLANLFSPEKVYATIGTFYPDADPETSTVDGYVVRNVVDEPFSTIRDSAGKVADSSATNTQIRLLASATSDQFNLLGRSYALFNTSTISANGVISSAIFSGYYSDKLNGLGSTDLHLAASTPASNTNLVIADYQNISRTSFGSITYANFLAAQYNDITLNAAGIANISKTGISKFSLQTSWDITNSFGGIWASSGDTYFFITTADTAGTSQDPKLTVTYTIVIPPKQDVIWFD